MTSWRSEMGTAVLLLPVSLPYLFKLDCQRTIKTRMKILANIAMLCGKNTAFRRVSSQTFSSQCSEYGHVCSWKSRADWVVREVERRRETSSRRLGYLLIYLFIIYVCIYLPNSSSIALGNSGRLYWVRLKHPQEQHRPVIQVSMMP